MSGRTHRSAPTQCGKRSGDNGKRRGKRTFPQRGGTEPAPYRGSGAERSTAGCAWGVASASQIPKRNLGRRSGRRPLRKAQSTTQASRRAAKRPRPRTRGMGGNRRKDHPKKGGTAPRPPRQRLAKRKARKEQLVKFGLCPMTELCSTAYWVRKSDESPARALVGAASTEQNGLEPHPAAREGAPRP